MKTLRLLFALMGAAPICIAQGPSLTKEETVNYLNKKAKEVIGHYRSIRSDDNKSTITYYYSENSVSMSGDKLVVAQERRSHRDNVIVRGVYYPCSYHRQKHENTFNPAHILSIEKDANIVSGEPLGTIKITLKYNTGQWGFSLFAPQRKVNNPNDSDYGLCYDLYEYMPARVSATKNIMYLTYLQSDETNFTKIKKALEYLRDLCKAEDDPFGN